MEFAGAFGDFGTLLPFAVAYITICGLDPCSVFLGIGITNICLALYYRLPLPVQPKKALGVVAIRERWPANMVYGTGIMLGVIWLAAGFSGAIGWIVRKVPKCVLRGIQLGLGLAFALEGAGMIQENLLLGAVSLALSIAFVGGRKVPVSLIVLGMGIAYSACTGCFSFLDLHLGLYLPSLYLPSIHDMLYGFVFAGFAQLFLTLTNAVIATASLVQELFPDNPRSVTPRNLVLNMGVMNSLVPFFGGMPMCHGAGGLAAQYAFGARTGGAILMEGAVEVLLAFFLAGSIETISNAFPLSVLGAMLMMAGLQLSKAATDVTGKDEIFIMLLTAVIGVAYNIAVAFIAGLVVFLAMKRKVIQI
jgi:MFS superfamily sulfate permease-like transporter